LGEVLELKQKGEQKMLFVRVEIWPYGNQNKSQIIGVGSIVNDGTGNEKKGNYKTQFYLLGDLIREGKFTEYDRQKGNVWDILQQALTSSKKISPSIDQISKELEKENETTGTLLDRRAQLAGHQRF
jgi:hypothetical protein